MDLRIIGGRTLVGGRLEETTVHLSDGVIADVGADRSAHLNLDGHDLLVLPGIVDIHGDAFERQMMPRPGVSFSTEIALLDSDRQAIANGITTLFHGVTWSWEPGLRSADNARKILAAIESLGDRLAADTRYHLRHETFNFEAEPEIADWLAARRIHAVAFNDHLPSHKTIANRPHRINEMAVRAGLSWEDFLALVERLRARSDEVPPYTERIAAVARGNDVPLLSHDDASPERRGWFRSLGCRVSEFPMNVETARDAARAGDDVVFGAPNVVRGGSHIGWASASRMVAEGLCSVLASDYYYPAPLVAAFRLVNDGVASLESAWRLVSEGAARAVGLTDRGRIAHGQRADLILVDDAVRGQPRVISVIAAGRMVYLNEPQRLLSGAFAEAAQ